MPLTAPLPEENLPEMGGNLGPCPCPRGPAASAREPTLPLCPPARSAGSQAATSFPGGSAKDSPEDGAGAAKLPRGPLGRRRG